jgi:hypothetical protein
MESTRVLIKRCYSFGGATFLPDDHGNFQSVDKWRGDSIKLALDTVKKSIGTNQTLVLLDVKNETKTLVDVTITAAMVIQPPIAAGVVNDKNLFTIMVFTRLKTM